MKLKLSAKFV